MSRERYHEIKKGEMFVANISPCRVDFQVYKWF